MTQLGDEAKPKEAEPDETVFFGEEKMKETLRLLEESLWFVNSLPEEIQKQENLLKQKEEEQKHALKQTTEEKELLNKQLEEQKKLTHELEMQLVAKHQELEKMAELGTVKNTMQRMLSILRGNKDEGDDHAR